MSQKLSPLADMAEIPSVSSRLKRIWSNINFPLFLANSYSTSNKSSWTGNNYCIKHYFFYLIILVIAPDKADFAITKTRLFKYIENFTSKNWKFSDKKNSDIFHISALNTDCWYSLEPPRRGGSNEYPQSMLLSRNKKNNVYPCKPQFFYIKVGFQGVKIIQACFRDATESVIYVRLL